MKSTRQIARLGLAVISLASASCVVAETNPYYVGVSQAFTHESNVFRVATGQAESSDTYSTTSLLAGIDQPFGRRLPATLGDLFDHRCHLALIAAHGNDLDADDDLALAVGTILHVVSRSKSAIAHLHHRGVRIRRRGPCRFARLALTLLDGGQFR